MSGVIRIDDLTGGQLAKLRENADFAVLPLGAVEWHGPHLPLGTDLQLATTFAEAVEDSRWTCALYPPLPYAACPGQTRGWPGTVWVRPEIAVAFVSDVLASIVRAGFRRVLVVNGHDANMSVARAAMEWVSGHEESSFLLCNWFQLVRPDETAQLFGVDVISRGHGGAFETAGLLGCGGTADLSSADDLPPRVPLATPHAHALIESRPHPFNGWSGHPSRVTPEAGARIRALVTERLRELVAAWLASPKPDPPIISR